MANQYQWLTYSQAKTTLAQRLADPGFLFWTNPEVGLYIIEALRTWNALTEMWNADYTFNTTNAAVWYNLATQAGSPRLQTVHDTDLYTLMQYHLLEPPTGGMWTGTSQFSITDFQGALQRRRDECLQYAACNLSIVSPLPSTPNQFRVILGDTILEPRRTRFIPDSTPTNFGKPVTLTREDRQAFDTFEADHLQTSAMPSSFSVVAGPPLSFDTDVAPNVPGFYELLALFSGNNFVPPQSTLVGLPDDWVWVAKWGAMADLLSRESEATDRMRAEFCLMRYMDGLKAIKQCNWLLNAEINGVPVDTPSLAEMDSYSPEWQENETWPTLVVAGMDFIAPVPVANPNQTNGVEVTLVGAAPIPILDGDFLQVSRDVFDAVLGYAQVLAMFKMGGSEFQDGKQLMTEFATAVLAQNKRTMSLGIFTDVLKSASRRQDENQER